MNDWMKWIPVCACAQPVNSFCFVNFVHQGSVKCDHEKMLKSACKGLTLPCIWFATSNALYTEWFARCTILPNEMSMQSIRSKEQSNFWCESVCAFVYSEPKWNENKINSIWFRSNSKKMTQTHTQIHRYDISSELYLKWIDRRA